MATYTIYGDTADGDVYSQHFSTYSLARTSGSTIDLTTGNSGTGMVTGQEYNATQYYCYEAFCSFDTSAVTGTPLSVTLDLYLYLDRSTTDFTVEARAADWGTSVTAGDWISGANLGSYSLRASLSTASMTNNQYNALTSDSSFVSNLANPVRLVLCSSRHRVGNAPSGTEYVAFKSGDATPQATYAPRLTVVTDASFGQPPTRRRPSGLYVR